MKIIEENKPFKYHLDFETDDYEDFKELMELMDKFKLKSEKSSLLGTREK